MEILEEYGPVVGLFLIFILLQTRWIERLLDRNERAYTGEIKRMNGHMNMLLEHILGKQPSSQSSPTVQEMISDAGNKTEEESE